MLIVYFSDINVWPYFRSERIIYKGHHDPTEDANIKVLATSFYRKRNRELKQSVITPPLGKLDPIHHIALSYSVCVSKIMSIFKETNKQHYTREFPSRKSCSVCRRASLPGGLASLEVWVEVCCNEKNYF